MAINIILVMLAAVAVSEAWLIMRLQRRTAALIEHTAKLAEAVTANAKAFGAVKELIGENMKHLDALDEGFEAAAHNSCEFERELAAVKGDLTPLTDKLITLEDEFGALEEELVALKETFDATIEELTEAETEKARAEAKSEEAWAKGVSNIIGYGDDIPMVSMEGVYGRK